MSSFCPNEEFEVLNNIKAQLQSKLSRPLKNPITVILGSGLGDFAESLEKKEVFSYSELPHFKPTSVVGHSGRLVIGQIAGLDIMAFQGRFHRYEGHSPHYIVRPVRLAKLMGSTKLILTNASGSINPSYRPGDFTLIADHLNHTGDNPLIGKNIDELGERFPDMSDPYSQELRTLAKEVATELSVPLHEGVYVGVLGPSYETPAEVKMYQMLGADMVGMSTVFESIAANHMQMDVLGISCITNLASGIGSTKLAHNDVKDVAAKSSQNFEALLSNIITRWPR